MNRIAAALLLFLALVVPAAAQVPGGSVIQLNATPVTGSPAPIVGDCLRIITGNKVGQVTCGGGTAAAIVAGTGGTTVTGGANSGILWGDASGLVQRGPARTDSTGNLTVPTSAQVLVPDGSATLASYGFTSSPTSGMFWLSPNLFWSVGGTSRGLLNSSGFAVRSDGGFRFYSSTLGGGSPDTGIYRISAGVMSIGNGTVGDFSGTLQAGKAALTVNNAFTLTNQVSTAAAQIATMTNGPVAGNPNFWLPVTINGVTRNIPAW